MHSLLKNRSKQVHFILEWDSSLAIDNAEDENYLATSNPLKPQRIIAIVFIPKKVKKEEPCLVMLILY